MAVAKVLIPVVVLPNREQPERETRLWEAWCRPASPSEQAREWMASLDDKRLHPAVHLLGPFKRYDSGVKGLWAVKRLLGVGGLVNDLETVLRQYRLDSGDGAAWVGRIEEHSSDLGLGLALIMAVMGTKERLLAATGALGDAQDCGLEDDVPVKPVRDVPEKLSAVLEKKRTGERFATLRIVFTPCHYHTPEGSLELVEWLDVTRELREAGVEVCPVRTFGEAARRLGIDATALETARRQTRARLEWRRRVARNARIVGGAMLGLGLAIAASVQYGLTGQVDLAWEPEPTLKPAEPQPYVVCSGNDGNPGSYAVLRKESFVPIVPAGSLLAWRVRIGDPAETGHWSHRLARLLGYEGYHIAVVMLGKTTGIGEEPVIVPKLSDHSSAVQRIRPGQVWSYGWKLDLIPEPSLLLILVNRRQPFDVAALNGELRRLFAQSSGKPAFSATTEYLRERADGVIAFPFETRTAGSFCPGRPTRSMCPRAQIESQPQLGSVYFPDPLAEPGWHGYAFVTDPAGLTRLALLPEATPGHFGLPLPGGRLYLVSSREPIKGLTNFSIHIPMEQDDMDAAKGATFLHGPIPRPLQEISLEGLPLGAQACSIPW